jgi:glycosyltransferase involved in cell wall biosynthesis
MSLNKYFFSIIIPVYNRSCLVKKTIDSFLDEENNDYQLILVDDGSTDNTLQILKSYESDNVKVFSKTNSERGAARNYGASKASGKYLIFFDSDDIILPDSLKKQYEYLTKNKYPEVAYTAFKICDSLGNLIKLIYVEENKFRSEIIKDNFLGCNSVVIRKDIFDKFKFNENRHLSTMEDKELWFRVSSLYRFKFIPIVSFVLVSHTTRSLNTISPEDKERVVNSFVCALEGNDHFKKEYGMKRKFIFAYEFALLSSMYSSINNKNKAFIFLKKSLNSYPLIIFSNRFLAAMKNFICMYV